MEISQGSAVESPAKKKRRVLTSLSKMFEEKDTRTFELTRLKRLTKILLLGRSILHDTLERECILSVSYSCRFSAQTMCKDKT